MQVADCINCHISSEYALLRRGTLMAKEAFYAMQESEKILEGVCCEVENCVYNNGRHCCTAERIQVKNRMAILGEETMCETFEEI